MIGVVSMEALNEGRVSSIRVLLSVYNGFVVMIFAVFIAVTQYKINLSMSANNFLSKANVLPVPAEEIIIFTIASFIVLIVCGYIYTRGNNVPDTWRYGAFILEVAACVFLMRTINMSYDGVALLLIADLMFRYEGHKHLIMMLIFQVMMYIVISYNISIWQMQVIPFSLYLDYYSTSAQNMILPMKNLLNYGNFTLFVVYIVLLLQNKRKENEQIAMLNSKLMISNEKLNESNNNLYLANKGLNTANKKLREYAMTIAGLTEIRERNRLAREIHDTLGHALTGIVAGLDACMVTMDIAPEATKVQLGKIREAAQRGMTDVRRSMHKLRPDDLEKLSIEDALKKMVHGFVETGGTKVKLDIEKMPKDLRDDQTEVIYRIVQEGMTNASRHGHAKNVEIYILGADNELSIVIADDGIGCKNIKDGFGLHHMRERVNMLGGSINCWSETGFVLDVTLPLNRTPKGEKQL